MRPVVRCERRGWLDRLKPTSSRRLFFDRNRRSIRPFATATAEKKGVISCESLQLIAFFASRYLTINNEKSPGVYRFGEGAVARHCGVTEDLSGMTLTFANWNRISQWLRQIDAFLQVA